MSKLQFATVAILGLSIVACSAGEGPARPSPEDDLAAIAEARTRLHAALADDDVAGIIAGLADDHLTMAPDGATPANNQVLSEWHQARVDNFTFESTFNTDDIRLFGDIAIERFSSDSRLAQRTGGDEIADTTKGVWIWERQEDGSWKLLWSIWNSDLPLEARCEGVTGA